VSELGPKRRGLPIRVKMRHEAHFVEELAGRHEAPLGRMIPLSAIEADPEQPRSTMGDLSDLVASIRDKGILEPLLLRPLHGDTEDPSGKAPVRYRIIAGERRYRAALQAGLYEVPAIEMDVNEDEALEIALIENLQRKDLTPFEEAEGYQALADRHGYTHEDIAGAMGRSRTVITESLQLLKLPPRVRDAVQALGIQTKSTILELLKAPNEQAMLDLLEKVAKHGLSRDDLRSETRSKPGATSKRPYVFKFKAPDKKYSLALTFRQSTVDRDDLIQALQSILEELKRAED
jgi:ParB family transcriptional regulator, chromosome partitioning protein